MDQQVAFSIATGLGSGLPALGAVSHGWASLNPAISTGDLSAIEYVSYYYSEKRNRVTDAAGMGTFHNPINIVFKNITIPKQVLNRASGLPSVTKYLDAQVVSGPQYARDVEAVGTRNKVISKVGVVVSKALARDGYREYPERQFLKEINSPYFSIDQALGYTQAFGMQPRSSRPSSTRVFLYSRPDCPSNDKGMRIAFFSSTPDDRFTYASYGEISLTLTAIGECSIGGTRSLERTISDIKALLTMEIKR